MLKSIINQNDQIASLIKLIRIPEPKAQRIREIVCLYFGKFFNYSILNRFVSLKSL